MNLGGDVHILYDQTRNEELYWGTRLQRINGRDIYLHLHELCKQCIYSMRL